MSRTEQQGVSLEPPEGWTDRSVLAFAGPELPGRRGRPNVVVTTEPMEASATLPTHLARHIVQLGQRLPRFELLENGATTVGGLPAALLTFVWMEESGWVEQSAALVERTRDGERLLTTITSTMPRNLPTGDALHVRETLRGIVASIAFDDGRSDVARSSPPSSGVAPPSRRAFDDPLGEIRIPRHRAGSGGW
jgi:hypothetical protein